MLNTGLLILFLLPVTGGVNPAIKNILKKKYPVRGIDISHHQGRINWKVLKTRNIHFVYIKATEGGTFRDPRFKSNWHSAKRHGFRYGAYHFYTFCRSGKQQAGNFISVVPRDKQALPPVVDIEFRGNCKRRPSQASFNQDLHQYLRAVTNRYGKQPVLYLTYDSFNRYFKNHFKSYPIWIRDYDKEPSLPGNRRWIYWQYSNRGKLKGIRGYVDLNVRH